MDVGALVDSAEGDEEEPENIWVFHFANFGDEEEESVRELTREEKISEKLERTEVIGINFPNLIARKSTAEQYYERLDEHKNKVAKAFKDRLLFKTIFNASGVGERDAPTWLGL